MRNWGCDESSARKERRRRGEVERERKSLELKSFDEGGKVVSVRREDVDCRVLR